MRKSLMAAAVALSACAAVPAAKAEPALVFDAANGTVLYSEDADALWHPASLTKLMTAYVAFHAIRAGEIALNTQLVCSANANAQPPSKIGLPVGGGISLELALKALIVKSGNDIAVMIAEGVAGSEPAFIQRMNQTARRLGMSRTVFYNPHGLPHSEQVTTARDLARLSRAIVVEFPEYAEMFAMTSVAVGNSNLRTHNSLLVNFEGADGLKTGFICDSGYNVVSSATRNGRRVVAVVLGARSGAARRDRAAELMEHGFRRFFWKSVFAPTIESLAVDASVSAAPISLREEICNRPRPIRANVIKTKKKGGGRKQIKINPDGAIEAGAAAGGLPKKKKPEEMKRIRVYGDR
jgi:D-alanyl-D-alanine carboxypeptidase